jgi:hypothetical protein
LPDPIIGKNAQPQNCHPGKSTESNVAILSKVAHNGNIQFFRAGKRHALYKSAYRVNRGQLGKQSSVRFICKRVFRRFGSLAVSEA